MADVKEEENTETLKMSTSEGGTAIALSIDVSDEPQVKHSSLSAERVVPGCGHYGAAIAALHLLTKNPATELGPWICANAIIPRFIPSETVLNVMQITDGDLPSIEKQLNPPADRLGAPKDNGAAILYLVAPSGSLMTGQILNVSGGR